MKNMQSKNRRAEVQKNFENLKSLMVKIAKPANEIYLEEGEVYVISLPDLLDWISNCQTIRDYQEAIEMLSNTNLSKRQRNFYEQQFATTSHVKHYIDRNKNGREITTKELDLHILRDKCKSILAYLSNNELCVFASLFFKEIDAVKKLELVVDIRSIEQDLSKLKRLSEKSYLETVESLNTASNLLEYESIIPLHIYCQHMELIELIALHVAVDKCAINASLMTGDLEKTNNEFSEFGAKLKKELNKWIREYPCLANTPLFQMDWKLLDEYTKSPEEIVEMFGGDVVCFPYRAPIEMKYNIPLGPPNN